MILITLLAGILRVIRVFEEERFSNDVYLYFQMAKDWAHHGVDYMCSYNSPNIPPLLPWVMAMGYNFGLSPDYTGLIIGILLGSLMPLAAFWVALNLFSSAKQQKDDVETEAMPRNHVYALLAAFLMAVHPFFVRISVSCLREILYLPLLVFAIAFAISAIYNRSLWRWCAFAVLAAFANMARSEGIILILIPFAWQAVELVIAHKNFKKNIAYYILTLVLVSVIFLGFMLSVLYILRDTSCTWSPFVIWNIKI